MLDYRLDCQERDGTWSVQKFRSVDDPEAVSHALIVRTAYLCKLYQADHWLATFDGTTVADEITVSPVNDNNDSSFAAMTAPVADFHRCASEAPKQSQRRRSVSAQFIAQRMAERRESLWRAIQAEQRRRTFHDVNSFRGEKPWSPK